MCSRYRPSERIWGLSTRDTPKAGPLGPRVVGVWTCLTNYVSLCRKQLCGRKGQVESW